MPDLNLRSLTNSFLDVRLASLASWKQANEITPRDRGGPYVVLQAGYDPADPKVIPDEFVIGRSGKWIPVGLFYKLPVPERRAEYVFGTAAEIMKMMENLPPNAVVFRPSAATDSAADQNPAEPDEMAAALQAGKNKPPGSAS